MFIKLQHAKNERILLDIMVDLLDGGDVVETKWNFLQFVVVFLSFEIGSATH
jgi:hypothetical protein